MLSVNSCGSFSLVVYLILCLITFGFQILFLITESQRVSVPNKVTHGEYLFYTLKKVLNMKVIFPAHDLMNINPFLFSILSDDTQK